VSFAQLHEHHHTRPFEPYRLTQTDGRAREVVHPELFVVGVTASFLFLPQVVHGVAYADRMVRIANEHVTACVPLAVPV
jgi:hypothetical protein